MNRTSKTLAIAFVVAGLAAAPVALAQDDSDTKHPSESQDMQEMMKGMQGNGMGMMGMMSQMNEMMSTCNKMMKAMMQDRDDPGQKDEQSDKG